MLMLKQPIAIWPRRGRNELEGIILPIYVKTPEEFCSLCSFNLLASLDCFPHRIKHNVI